MSRFKRMAVLGRVLESGLVPIFFNPDVETGRKIITACVKGGATVMEMTNRGDGAYDVFRGLMEHVKAEHPDLMFGVGSVLEPATAAMYINAGADLVVCPNLNPEVGRLCNRRKVAWLPGCGTVSEISRAEELGVEIVKIFPGGQLGGPAFVKALMGPMPWTNIMPTGGVSPTRESVGEWIKAGAACLGMGSKLIAKDLVAEGDYQGISRNVAHCLELVREARA